MRARQPDAAIARRDPHGGYENESVTFCSRLVGLVLGNISDPLLHGGGLPEIHSGLSPPQPYKPIRRLFENLNVLNPAADVCGVFDVFDRAPDRRLVPVHGYMCFTAHVVL